MLLWSHLRFTLIFSGKNTTPPSIYLHTPPTHSRLLTFKRHNSRESVGTLTFKASTTYCPRSWRPEGESTERPWSSRVSPIHQHGRVSSCNSKNEIGASGQTARVSCPSGDGHFLGLVILFLGMCAVIFKATAELEDSVNFKGLQ